MKKNSLWGFFIVILVLLFGYAVFQKFSNLNKKVETRSKITIPQVEQEQKSENKSSDLEEGDTNRASFLTLANDETLIDTLLMDFNGDGQEDQISAIKTPFSPFISLVISIFNPETASFERKTTIATRITQVKTFSFVSMDVIGNHKNSLVYQGFSENGDSVLQIINGNLGKKNVFEVLTIGDFVTEGTIYLQQLDRDESYELNQAKGKSFPIWVSATEEAEGTNQYDQLQMIFNYDEKLKRYEQTSLTRVPQSRLAQRELQKIQDGTVETFAKFLNGLWYKTENASSIRYLYFDWDNKEIVFLFGESEEVYSWNNSSLRRNGIYLNTVNSSIENLQRRFDISLVAVDSIRLKLQDDVRMIIKESNVWDGNYKKMADAGTITVKDSEEYYNNLAQEGKWESPEGYIFDFEKGNLSVKTSSFIDKGAMSSLNIAKTELLQFKTFERDPVMAENSAGTYIVDPNYKNSPSVLTGTYIAEYKLVEPARPAVKKTKARPAIYDKNTVTLSPVNVSPTGFYKTDGKTVTVTRVIEK